MKIASAAAIVLALTTGTALAADLPSIKGPPPAPLPPPPPLWTGFYLGLNAGGTWADNNSVAILASTSYVNPAPGGFFNPAPWAAAGAVGATRFLGADNSGFIGGGQVGFNYQIANFVAGVEADIQGVAGGNNAVTGVTAVAAPAGFSFETTLSATRRLDYIGTVRGRIGYLITPTLLAYATGGLAWGGVSASASVFQTVPNDLPGFAMTGFTRGSLSQTEVGWTVGGGAEWMFLPNWSAKVEYLYYDLGRVAFAVGPTSRSSGATLLWTNHTTASTRFNGHIVRAGLNYHFNLFTPAPVVAQY